MKDFLRESFPNPERKGCPEEDTLQALAEDRISPNDPALLHVGSCSECYAEYLHLRQDFEESQSARVLNPSSSSASKDVLRMINFPAGLKREDS
jgi:hypothetical protein